MAEQLYPHLRAERRGEVLWVWLNRPEVHNAFNGEMVDSLRRCFEDAAEQGDLGAVVLSGRGASFCAGADLEWMRASLEWTWEQNVEDALGIANMLEAIERCPKPVLCRVNGAAFGGGLGLIAACDVAIANREAQFGFTEVRLGIVPAAVSPFVVRKIGPGHARALFVTGARFSAERAMQTGLVHRVTAPDELDRAVDQVLNSILEAGPKAVETAKRLVLTVADLAPEEAKKFTAETIAGIRTSSEGQEGMRAFLERRKPKWDST